MNIRDKLRVHLLTKQNEPIVFRDMISEWPARHWTPDTLAELFQDETLTFRVGKRNFTGVQWENDCAYTDATISEFNSWLNGSSSSVNPLNVFTPDAHWAYADYKYMAKIFKHKPHILRSVDWGAFGFESRDGADSTFWFGTRGANTVCHYDTYGCNLVAQIYGHKRWVLFPPSDVRHLYPTRVPYEESSVFSSVDILSPDLQRFPLFKNATPYVVTLGVSDVLYVPHHWWHYVESLDTSISVNTWIDMDIDRSERFQEAVTRTLAFALMSQSDLDSWLNDTEDVTSHAENIGFLKSAAIPLANREHEAGKSDSHLPSGHETDAATDTNHQHMDKKLRMEISDVDTTTSRVRDLVSKSTAHERRRESGNAAVGDVIDCDKAFDKVNLAKDEFDVGVCRVERVSRCTVSELMRPCADETCDARIMRDDISDSHVNGRTNCSSAATGKSVSDLDMNDIVEAVLHPDVVKLICEKLAVKFSLNR